MKRRLLNLVLLLVIFVVGYVSAVLRVTGRDDYKDELFRSSIADIRQRTYAPNFLFLKEGVPNIESHSATFDPAKSAGSIMLSYVGGLGGADHSLQLRGDGGLYSIVSGDARLVTTIDHDRCTALFKWFLTSGILNYSDEVVEIKRDLLPPNGWKGVTDNPNTEIHVSIPELKVDKNISAYAPRVELENFPDIIELQLVTQFEKEMLGLVPKDFPLWK